MVDLVRRIEAATPTDRDRAIDALRAYGVLGIVLGHWAVTSLVLDSGTLRGASPLQSLTWLAPASWVLQTLAVFFFVGGFAAVRSLESARGRGESAGHWLRRRMVRMFGPVVPLLVVWTVAALVMLACGVEAGTVHLLLRRALTPLWFLLVFAGITLATPVLARLRPLICVVSVALLVVVVDVLRFGIGASGDLGWLTVAAWLIPYGLGMAWARGDLDPRRAGPLLLGGGVVATTALVWWAGYPVSMVGVPGAAVSNLNPPTLAAVAFGLAQCGAALLLAEPIRRMLARPRVWAGVALVNLSAITIFLWHQTALLAVTAIGLVSGRAVPGLHTPPDDVGWVLARLAWIPAFVLVLLACRAAFGSYETRRTRGYG